MTYHVLNEDALGGHFPDNILGERVVWREALIDGPLADENFFEAREAFINSVIGSDQSDYKSKVLEEFKKLNTAAAGSRIYLWFEDDLFCQVNYWFLVFELKDRQFELFRVFPDPDDFYFNSTSSQTLTQCFHISEEISNSEAQTIAALWQHFKINRALPTDFRTETVRHIRELSAALKYMNSGHLKSELRQIYDEKGNFSALLDYFRDHHHIYSLGDVQIKRLLEQ